MRDQSYQKHSGEEHVYGRQKIRPIPFWRRHLVLIIVIMASVLMIVFASTTIALLARPNASTQLGIGLGTPTQAIPTSLPSPIPTESTPASIEPIATPVTPGTYQTPTTIPENIILECDCSDPVVVTTTKIVIEPQKNRMNWSLKFYNNSQGSVYTGFDKFSLQKGDQVHDPTEAAEQTYNPTGPVIGSGLDLKAGETRQEIVITFSFVPYQGMPIR